MTGVPDEGRQSRRTCGRCDRPFAGRPAYMIDGTSRCLRCTLLHKPLLRRSSLTALVVGTILVAINQGALLAGGQFPPELAWKLPMTYSVPFCVATWGALTNSRTG